MEPYNYSRKFLDYTDHPYWCGANNNEALDLANLIRSDIEEGIKYILPPEGQIGINVKDCSIYKNIIRLPYPKITLEMPLTGWTRLDNIGGDSSLVPTIISLIQHTHKDMGFYLTPVQCRTPSGKEFWNMSKYGAELTEEDIQNWSKGDLSKVSYSVCAHDKEFPVSDLDEVSGKAGTEEFKQFFGRLMRIALEFIIYANTRNIGVETIYAPPKLNKKRAKRGLKPNYDYKILSIHKTIIKTAGSSSNVGHHRNKAHLVCGHPRFYKNKDKPIWIKPYARGDESLGVVHKSYKI